MVDCFWIWQVLTSVLPRTDRLFPSRVMIPVSKADVPDYLQEGEFYKSLNDEDNDTILVPERTLKADGTVTCTSDLDHILSSLRYWAVDKVPRGIIQFILQNSTEECMSTIAEYGSELPYLHTLQMLQLTEDRDSRYRHALESGNMEIVQYLSEQKYVVPHDAGAIVASRGDTACLQFLFQHTTRNIWDASVCSAAVQAGSLECLKLAHRNGCLWTTNTAVNAARWGRLNCLKYLHEQGCLWDEQVCRYAAAGDHLECLQYAHQRGCKWDFHVCREAALCGSLRCLQYAHENGATWDSYVCMNAAQSGSLECLQYAHEHGCPWDVETTLSACEYGNLACLAYAVEHDCVVNNHVTRAAAANGHLDCLAYLHEHECPWDEFTTKYALMYDHRHCFEYAAEHGCPVVVVSAGSRSC